MSGPSDTQPAGVTWTVAFVSAAALGFEISLMRLLLVAGWHHFAFLVISMVLLGLGASGTALCLARTWVMPRAGRVLWVLALATASSMPLCTALVQHVPVEARIVPALLWRQIGCWVVYWAILAIPFFLAGATVGLALMMARQRVARVYAANLVGSAAGGVLATVGMYFLPAEWLPVATGVLGLIGSACLGGRRLSRRVGGFAGCGLAVAGCLWLAPPHVQPDPDKYSAYVQRLVRQGSAKRIAAACGPRALVEAYEGEVFHEMPFLGVGTAPPPILALTVDGHWAGSVLRVAGAPQAEVVDRTMMAFPYSVAPDSPRTLLLGERGGANIWLAKRAGACRIDVVQPDAKLLGLLGGPLRDLGGSVFCLPDVRVAVTEPRHFVEHSRERFDVIQLVTLEGSGAGSGGIGGLAQDHLSTVEGVEACLNHLSTEGVLFACRGMQTPPRDNLKLLATFVEALRHSGVTEPERHIVVIRDYLAVCTVAKASPWAAPQIARIRRVCAERELTPVWFPGIRADELNQPDALSAAPDGVGDWYHYAARRLFSPAAETFLEEWSFAIRPATDERPFFLDFCKLGALGELRRSFGDMWVTRTELAYPLVCAAAIFVGVVGAALTLLPLAFGRTATTLTHRWPTVGYFAAIGLAYLLLEMTFLSRLTYLIGDPVQAAAVTICTFLFASGLGSLTAQRYSSNLGRTMRTAFLALLIIGVLELVGVRTVVLAAGSWTPLARSATAAVLIAPLAYVMGFPMPAALARLDRGGPALIPWAWGVNGFASVLAAPLATVIGMTWGFGAAGAGALVLYLLAALLWHKLPGDAAGSRFKV